MTAKIGSAATAKVMARIVGPAGINARLGALTQGARTSAAMLDAAQVRWQNVAPGLAERNGAMQYPAVNVYCEKIVNAMTEKFRAFSGRVQMAIELRHSQDRLDGLQERLEVYVDAAMNMLDTGRGDWGDEMFYGGGYTVSFDAVKQGGKNYIQAAKLTFEIGVSRN